MLRCLKKKISVLVLTGSGPAKPLDSLEFRWLAFEWSFLTVKLNPLYSGRLTCVGHFLFLPFLWGGRQVAVVDTGLCEASRQIKFLLDHLGKFSSSCFCPSSSEIFYVLAPGRWSYSYILGIFLFIGGVCLLNLTIHPSSLLGFLIVSSLLRTPKCLSRKRTNWDSPSTSAIVDIFGWTSWNSPGFLKFSA